MRPGHHPHRGSFAQTVSPLRMPSRGGGRTAAGRGGAAAACAAAPVWSLDAARRLRNRRPFCPQGTPRAGVVGAAARDDDGGAASSSSGASDSAASAATVVFHRLRPHVLGGSRAGEGASTGVAGARRRLCFTGGEPSCSSSLEEDELA